jgi:large subunit ribosomal protein L17
MRHRNTIKKLGRPTASRKALLSNLVNSLIIHKRIKTTLAKAKAMRDLADHVMILAKRGDLHARRQAAAVLRQKDTVQELFGTLAAQTGTRISGFTRVTHLGRRHTDSAEMAFIEWVDIPKAIETLATTETAAATEGSVEAAAESPDQGKA